MPDLHPRYRNLRPCTLEELPSLVNVMSNANYVTGFAHYESAPLWPILNELLREEKITEVGHLFWLGDKGAPGLVLAWDESCWGGKASRYDYATLFPLTTNVQEFRNAVVQNAKNLSPFTDVPFAVAQHFEPEFKWVYTDVEYRYPTLMLQLVSAATIPLSKPMRKRVRAIRKLRENPLYENRSIDEVSDAALLACLETWLALKVEKDDEVDIDAEYRYLSTRRGRDRLRQCGVNLHGIAMLECSTGNCVGFTVSTAVSTNTWAVVMRVSLREPSYVGEALWLQEAHLHPPVTWTWETDGGGSQGYDNKQRIGLTAQKHLYLRATKGALKESGALINTPAQAKRFEEHLVDKKHMLESLETFNLL